MTDQATVMNEVKNRESGKSWQQSKRSIFNDVTTACQCIKQNILWN